ncbi:TonB-dependent receptor [Helicobacter sp. 11S02629-2]|uniref:TonB-dependent receptor domain-containing protein n=1 Tax=Helicobacter sp. 11S02629-2 TaxID=1476195 RepID=UPI000BA51302|nr:TonB-dependent receptor [Helicobacter sp. 11S02629-2]PAF45864.1 hypothetical protein BKH40_00150 [Helicobacter sp. 11S02629-2]
MKKYATLALTLGLLFAQDDIQKTDDKEQNTNHTRLDKVVATASGFEQNISQAPASISVVTPEDLSATPVRDIAEALQDVPGVSIDSGVGKTGGWGITIRGMPQAYTLFLQDGKRLNVTTGTLPNGFSETLTSFMPPLNAIERIEVIRGPMSTLYGSDAIGGVVNIITKKSFDKWGGSITMDGLVNEDKAFGNTASLGIYTAGPLDKAKYWGLTLRAREFYRTKVNVNDFKRIPNLTFNSTGINAAARNNVVGLSESNIYNIGSRLIYTPSAQNSSYIDLDWGSQWYDNSLSQLGTIGAGYGPSLTFDRLNAIAAHDGKYEVGGLLRRISTDTSLQLNYASNFGRQLTADVFTNRPAERHLTGQSRDIYGIDVIADQNTKFDYETVKLTVGGRYWFNSMNDRVIPNTSFIYQHNAAIFAEAQIEIIDNLLLTLGNRINYNSAFGFNNSPRVYLVYNPLEWLTVKGGVAQGYKTPNVNQLVPGVINLTGQGQVLVYGNPTLRPETSTNYELAVATDNDWFEASLTGFYVDFRDRIGNVNVSPQAALPGGGGICTPIRTMTNGNAVNSNVNRCQTQENQSSALSYGAEVFFGLKPVDVGVGAIKFNASYTFNKTEAVPAQSARNQFRVPFTDVPLHTLNSAITYILDEFNIFLRGEFRGDTFRQEITSAEQQQKFINAGVSQYYKDYFLLHIGANYTYKITKDQSIKLSLGINNLLNQDFFDYTVRDPLASNGSTAQPLNAYNYIREGRRYYGSVTYNF